jgi:hypothetical protein
MHRAKGDKMIKGQDIEAAKPHLRGIRTGGFIPGAEVIYVPLDKAMLKENPSVALDAPPAQIFPGF